MRKRELIAEIGFSMLLVMAVGTGEGAGKKEWNPISFQQRVF